MKLYWFDTPNPRKVCVVARHLGSPVEHVRVDLTKGEQRAPAFLAINPNGKVPVLEDGELHLWEATAIMVHLARRAGSDLWPEDDRQVEVMRWLSWDALHWGRHAGIFYFEHVIKAWLGGEPDPAALGEADGQFRRFAGVLEDHLKDRRWLVGDKLSLADLAVGNYLAYAEQVPLPLAPFPAIRRWHDRLNELPAWRQPFPAVPGA